MADEYVPATEQLPGDPGLSALPTAGETPLEAPATDTPRTGVEAPIDGTVQTINNAAPEQAPAADLTQQPSAAAPVPAAQADAIPPAAAPTHGVTIATCTLQPNPRYGDDALGWVPGWSAITLLNDTQPDEYGRLWQRVNTGTAEGYIQLQNIRIG